MKKILSIFLLATLGVHAQDDPCIERILNKPGSWGKPYRPAPVSAAQTSFQEALHRRVLGRYRPQSLHVIPFFEHSSFSEPRPVNGYAVGCLGKYYTCRGDSLELQPETSAFYFIRFNEFDEVDLYHNNQDHILTGYGRLPGTRPVELRPGIWRMPDRMMTLNGTPVVPYKVWLITFDGKLPFSYVTRKEFLQKRLANLQLLIKDENESHQEQLVKWAVDKKQYEEEWKNNPSRLDNYIRVTYTPGIELAKKNHQAALDRINDAIEGVKEQLQGPASELAKTSIVVRNQKNEYVYDFTDRDDEPFAEVPVQPNPSYFNRSLPKDVPQLITVIITYQRTDTAQNRFGRELEELTDFDYLRSCIGRTTAPPFPNGKDGATVTAPSGPQNDVPVSQNKLVNKATTKPVAVAENSKPAASSPASRNKKVYTLSGTLSAPAGVPVTLALNGTNDLTVTPPKSNRNLYNRTGFSFPQGLQENEAYDLSLKKIAGNMKGVVYRGKGNAPDGTNQLRVGVDYTYELLTRSSDDNTTSSFYESGGIAVGGTGSEEGRYIAFVSWTQGLEGASGKARQIFWRDRNTGITKLISVSGSGEQANGDCFEPSLSADGKTVVFESRASNLVAGDNNNAKDIFLWRAATNTLELVSKAANGGFADEESFDATISGNGQFVVFTSSAGNLTNLPKGPSITNVFVRDMAAGKTEMVSIAGNRQTGGSGTKGSISFDGSRVTFCSASGTLVPGDNNGLWDIFLWQRGQPGLKRISLTQEGKERNQGQESATRQVASVISGNGRYVAFATTASNMVPADNNSYQDVFVYNVETGKLVCASLTDNGQPANGDSPIEQGERLSLSYDGTWLAFPTKASNLGVPPSNIVLYNLVTGKKQAATSTQGSYVGRPALSYSGGYVVFGKGEALDKRFNGSGQFAHFTGNGPCRDCKE